MTCPKCGYDLSTVKKPKTSPENRLFHALVGKLAMWKKISPDLMKRYCKLYASSAHGYPCESIELHGHKIQEPKSVAKATSEETCLLINVCYELAMDWGIQLEQPDDSFRS
jgi:hypothetical protein